MIIPEKLLGAADLIISDADVNSASFVIHCGPEGEFVGKIILVKSRFIRDVHLQTGNKDTFKQAIYELLELCYQEIGDL